MEVEIATKMLSLIGRIYSHRECTQAFDLKVPKLRCVWIIGGEPQINCKSRKTDGWFCTRILHVSPNHVMGILVVAGCKCYTYSKVVASEFLP